MRIKYHNSIFLACVLIIYFSIFNIVKSLLVCGLWDNFRRHCENE